MYDVTISKSAAGTLKATASFYKSARDLFRAGPEAFNKLVYKALDHRLDGLGGIGPYKHSEIKKDGNVSPHLLVSEED